MYHDHGCYIVTLNATFICSQVQNALVGNVDSNETSCIATEFRQVNITSNRKMVFRTSFSCNIVNAVFTTCI